MKIRHCLAHPGRSALILFLLGMILAPLALAGEEKTLTPKSLAGLIKKKWARCKTVQYEVKLYIDMGYAEKHYLEKCRVQKKKMRTEAKDMEKGTTTLVVHDGKFRWVETINPNRPALMPVIKCKAGFEKKERETLFGLVNTLHEGEDPLNLLPFLMKFYDFKDAVSSEWEEQPVYLMEGTLKKKVLDKEKKVPEDESRMEFINQLLKVRLMFYKETLFLARLEVYGESPEDAVRVAACTGYETDVALDKELFEYTPPTGKKVMDMTRQK